MQRQLRWIGHVIWMQSNRLPRRIIHILRTVAWSASPRRSEEALLRSREGNLEEVLNTSWSARDTGIWQRSLEGYVWGGSDGFRHQLRPGGRSTSRSSTHDYKYSSIRSSLSYLWQILRVII